MFGKIVDAEEEAARDAAFPQGWFALALSDDLGPAAALGRRAFARDFVLWRTEDGQAHCAYAACPHYAADMSRGGTVVAGGLACPIHGLRFAPDGRCMPRHAGQPAPGYAIRIFPVREAQGLIHIWRDFDGQEPAKDPPLAEMQPGHSQAIGRWSFEGAFQPALEQIGAMSRQAGAHVQIHATPVETTLTEVIASITADRDGAADQALKQMEQILGRIDGWQLTSSRLANGV